MSNDMKISKVVEIIRKDTCADCENKCGLCNQGVCQNVVIEIGAYFLHVANKEQEEKE